MTLKTDKPIAEQRLEWAIAQLRHLNTTSNIGAVNRVIAALEEGQAGILSALATVEAERDAVYALGKIPVEQSQQIPLALWVQTRFVHVEDFNALAARFEDIARRVTEYQKRHAAREKARQEELAANHALDRQRYIEAMAVMNLAVQDFIAAESALLALQTETHDGK